MKWKIAAAAVIFLVAMAWILGLFGPSGGEQAARPPGQAEPPPPSPAVPEAKVVAAPPGPQLEDSTYKDEVTELPAEVLNYGLRLQTGARRVSSPAGAADYVTYAAQSDLRWEKLAAAISGKIMPFEVLSFAQVKKGAFAGGFHVEKAGLILARAIAQQLEGMGYRAAIRLDEVGQTVKLTPAEQLRGLEGEFLVYGAVEFRVEQAKVENLQQVLAAILCDVQFFGRRPVAGGRIKPIREVHVEDQEKVTFPRLEEAADQSRKAAAAVLARAVKKVLSDPGLEPALLHFVEER